MRWAIPFLAAGLLLAGCGRVDGQGDGRVDGRVDGRAASEPADLTARAVAAIALDHLSDDTSSRRAVHVDETTPAGLVGAELRYRAGEGDDGDLVRVQVVPWEAMPEEAHDGWSCGAEPEGCAELEGGVVLRWDLEAPEEDPGAYWVGRVVGGELVSAMAAGPAITGDPRSMSLEPSVDDLTEIVMDDRLKLRTTTSAVRAGEELDDWDGGEVDPAGLVEVPHSDASLAVGWIEAYGDFTYLGPSPLRDQLGAGAIGGRVRVGRDIMPVGSGTIDVLAAPTAPAWLADGGCLPEMTCHRFREMTFAFRPAEGEDPGEGWVIVVRPGGETVSLRSRGRRVPDAPREAAGWSGAWKWESDLVDEDGYSVLGMTTTAQRKARWEELAEAHSAR